MRHLAERYWVDILVSYFSALFVLPTFFYSKNRMWFFSIWATGGTFFFSHTYEQFSQDLGNSNKLFPHLMVWRDCFSISRRYSFRFWTFGDFLWIRSLLESISLSWNFSGSMIREEQLIIFKVFLFSCPDQSIYIGIEWKFSALFCPGVILRLFLLDDILTWHPSFGAARG